MSTFSLKLKKTLRWNTLPSFFFPHLKTLLIQAACCHSYRALTGTTGKDTSSLFPSWRWRWGRSTSVASAARGGGLYLYKRLRNVDKWSSDTVWWCFAAICVPHGQYKLISEDADDEKHTTTTNILLISICKNNTIRYWDTIILIQKAL